MFQVIIIKYKLRPILYMIESKFSIWLNVFIMKFCQFFITIGIFSKCYQRWLFILPDFLEKRLITFFFIVGLRGTCTSYRMGSSAIRRIFFEFQIFRHIFRAFRRNTEICHIARELHYVITCLSLTQKVWNISTYLQSVHNIHL